jgi:hypothetical protein
MGHVDKVDSNRKASQVFKNNPQGSRLGERPNNRWNCVQTDINKCKFKNWSGLETELTGKIPLRRRRYTLDCSAIEEEGEEEGEGEGEGGGGEEEEDDEKKAREKEKKEKEKK